MPTRERFRHARVRACFERCLVLKFPVSLGQRLKTQIVIGFVLHNDFFSHQVEMNKKTAIPARGKVLGEKSSGATQVCWSVGVPCEVFLKTIKADRNVPRSNGR
jgi:hypothetical protein